MGTQAKTFLVSTADFALKYNGVLACTGTTNLNTSIEVTMQEQNVNAGRGNKLVYSYKYGREMNITLEAADWKLEYIAANLGNSITTKLTDVYKLGECVQLTNGVGTLKSVPVGDVAVELADGSIVTVKPENSAIDLSGKGVENEAVRATYQFSTMAKSITIDADTSPNVFELVLVADKHNNRLGKVGSVEIVIPAYQPSGNFTINFTPDGVTSTNIDGKALTVEGDRCDDGSSVYAYINEFDDTASSISVSDIAVTPAVITMAAGDTRKLSVIGLKGGLYSPVELDSADCTFTSDTPASVTAEDGVITAVTAGSALVTAAYGELTDIVKVTVTE